MAYQGGRHPHWDDTPLSFYFSFRYAILDARKGAHPVERVITKTQRLLSEYHLLRHCQEVSMKELADCLPGSTKTFSRDLKLLRQTGVPIVYSEKRKAFVLEREGLNDVSPPDNLAQARVQEKLRRLFRLMDDLPEEDCDIWYRAHFPDSSQRTMQRDFALLNSLGYRVKYETEEFNSHDAGIDLPVHHYYCDRPMGTYELDTFKPDLEV